MKEITIQIPDNCELIKDGNTYVVKEKQTPPRSWEEFCKRYPKEAGGAFINSSSEIIVYEIPSNKHEKRDMNLCNSKEEAEAFLALIQLRQLRKAWVGDWEPEVLLHQACIFNHTKKGLATDYFITWHSALSFPTREMAEDFLNCFRDLCETAKILL